MNRTDELSAKIRRRVSDLRDGRGWTQDRLAAEMQRAGFRRWSQSLVAAVERGSRRLTLSELIGLSLVFECSVRDLVVIPGSLTLQLDDGPRLPAVTVDGALSGKSPEVAPSDIKAVRAGGTAPAIGDLERKLAARLDKRQPFEVRLATVIAASWVLYDGRTATEERDRLASEGRPKQWAGRDVAKQVIEQARALRVERRSLDDRETQVAEIADRFRAAREAVRGRATLPPRV
jgi:transcriptional regulator with XRE-family HTH domain